MADVSGARNSAQCSTSAGRHRLREVVCAKYSTVGAWIVVWQRLARLLYSQSYDCAREAIAPRHPSDCLRSERARPTPIPGIPRLLPLALAEGFGCLQVLIEASAALEKANSGCDIC